MSYEIFKILFKEEPEEAPPAETNEDDNEESPEVAPPARKRT
jgi:hypothetical protein